MLNVYDTIRSGLYFNKFEVGELLFVKYTCPIEDSELAVWTPCDYILHVLSGKKRWRTRDAAWTATAGQTFYVRKSAYVIDQFFEEEFCMLLFFLPDDFLRDTIRQAAPMPHPLREPPPFRHPVMEVRADLTLTAYFQSMLTYFTTRKQPPDALLTMKLAELVLNLLRSPDNPALAVYLDAFRHAGKPSLTRIMNENFRFNLTLDEYARLCHRSLSSFKRDFRACFHMPPGRWLLRKRLHHAADMMGRSDLNITQVALESGFTNLSHFSRTFRAEFGESPTVFRRRLTGS